MYIYIYIVYIYIYCTVLITYIIYYTIYIVYLGEVAIVFQRWLSLGHDLMHISNLSSLVLPVSVAEASRLIPGSVESGKWLVAIVVSLTPTANNIMVQEGQR